MTKSEGIQNSRNTVQYAVDPFRVGLCTDFSADGAANGDFATAATRLFRTLAREMGVAEAGIRYWFAPQAMSLEVNWSTA